MIGLIATFYLETLYPSFGQRLEIQKILYEEKTDHQNLIVFENSCFGRVLALDGVIQTTYADAAMYSEMLVHVPFLAHGAVENVLIIGGGDGSVLLQTLRYKNLKKAIVVDIDEGVVSSTKQWMPEICQNAFEDPRVEVVIQDATLYVKDCNARFDVIICDSTDPFGPGAVLFTEEFYGNCKKCLTEGGIFVNQNGVPFLQKEELSLTQKNRAPHFQEVSFYVVAVPSYIGGYMALGFATDDKNKLTVPLEILQKRREEIEGYFVYYTPQVHQAAFCLPSFMR